jgi:hypothetical protein
MAVDIQDRKEQGGWCYSSRKQGEMSKEPECANQKTPLDVERRFLPGAMALGVTAPRHDLAGSSAVIWITALDCIASDHS